MYYKWRCPIFILKINIYYYYYYYIIIIVIIIINIVDAAAVRAERIRCTLVLCGYLAPEVVSRRTKYSVPKIFISSYLYLCYKFRSSTITDKQ